MNAAQFADATPREATLAAELLADAIRNAHGNTGVLIRDLNLDAVEVCRQLSKLRDEGLDLRIAYLNPDASEAAHDAGIPSEEFDTSVEQAERWRNQRGLDALVVVVTESDQAKLTSLEDFVLIGPSSLRRLLVERAQLELSEINDVLPRWWGIIGQDEQTSFFDLLDYFLALEGLGPEEVKEAAATSINMLGLLPDPALFDDPSEKTGCEINWRKSVHSRCDSQTSARTTERGSKQRWPQRKTSARRVRDCRRNCARCSGIDVAERWNSRQATLANS